jgi:ParD-like antitoxin of type II bacterial toxin-antitoxin system
MKPGQDRVTRFAADLVDAAAIEGARQSRSAKQQLDHWARVGRAVTSGESASWRRVEAALAGRLPMSALSAADSLAFNAEVAARIDESLAGADYRAELAAEGVTTVAWEDGRLVEYQPDGSTRALTSGS